MSEYDEQLGVKIDAEFEAAIDATQRLLEKTQQLSSQLAKFAPSLNAIHNLAKGIKSLSSANLNNLDAQVDKTVSSLSRLSQQLSKMDLSGVTGASNALRQFLSRLPEFKISGIEQMKEIPSIMKSIEALDSKKIGAVFSTLSQQIQPFFAKLRESESGLMSLSSVIKAFSSFDSQVDKTKKNVKSLGNEGVKTSNKLRQMLNVGHVIYYFNMSKRLFSGIGNMLTKAVDFSETENLFSVAMRGMRDEAMKFQNQLSEMFGLAMPDMMQAQGIFKNMLSSLQGLNEITSAKLSETLTKMSIDFASLYNTTIEAAITKMQAALSRQVRPIRSVSGYDITQNVLGDSLKHMGIYDRAISQLSEMEKRLVIIYTLQEQMRASGAMGDFARTIEQPAQQLKVLQQQVSEIGRWIGSVFMGTIAKVLPYINGFAMAIKELVKAFAFFVGYEMPDSSGVTNVLDQMVGGANDYSDAIDNANSGLSDTAKKIKEINDASLPFDELHTISKPDSSGGGSGGSPVGGMIDPRILDALNKWDYMFGNVRMKALDIRDAILQWTDIIGKAINDNIFQPISVSWEKYGKGISENMQNSFRNVGYIISGMFDVAAEKWKPFFQQLSNFFFSLLDTASEVAEGITLFLVYIWDYGGKTLYEGIYDIVTAFLELAVSINDSFVKPLTKLVNSTLVPIIGSAVGTVLGFIGNLLKGLASIISCISGLKPIVAGLSAAFVTLFLGIKVGKFLEFFNSVKVGNSVMKTMIDLLYDHSKIFKKVVDEWISGGTAIGKLKSGYNTLNAVLMNTRVWKTLQSAIANASIAMLAFSKRIAASNSVVATLASKIVSGLGKALTWLAANPLAGAAMAIGVVVAALAFFNQSQKETTYELEECSKAVQEQVNRVNELSNAMDDAKISAEDRLASSEAEIKTLEHNIDALRRMGGESGYVDNIASASALVEEINQKLPDTVKLTEDGRLEWLKTPEAIQACTEALKEKARIEAYSQLYTEAVKAQITAEMEHGKVIQELNDKKQRQIDLQTRQRELLEILGKHAGTGWISTEEGKKYSQELKDISAELDSIPADIQYLEETLKTTETAWEEAAQYVNELSDAMSYNQDIMSNTSKALEGVSDANREALNQLGEGLSGSKKMLEDYANGIIDLDEKQVISAKMSKDEMIAQYAMKAVGLGKTYDEMYQIIMEQGIILSDEEKRQLESSLALFQETQDQELVSFTLAKERTLEVLKEHDIDMTAEEEKRYSTLLDMLNKHGMNVSAASYTQYQSMMKAMQEYNIDVSSKQSEQYLLLIEMLRQHGVDMSNEENIRHAASLIQQANNGSEEGKKFIEMLKKGVSSKNIDPEMREMLRKAGIVLEDNPQEVHVNVEDASKKAKTVYDEISKVFSKPLSAVLKMGLDLTSFGVAASNSFKAALGVQGFAEGGFPSAGQLFIMNEPGNPEFLANVGGRTGVANQGQMVVALESAMERGVLKAMSQLPQRSGETTLQNHTQVIVDGDIISDSVQRSNAKKGFDFSKGGNRKL